MKRLLLTILLWAPFSHADEVQLHLQAAHYDMTTRGFSDQFNNTTPGVGYRRGDYEIGAYINSYKNTSVYALIAFPVSHSTGIEVGLVTGYEHMYGMAIQPAVTAYATFGGFKLRVLPGSVIAFGLSYGVTI